MDCSPPGSSVHGTLQARILEWVAISFSRGSSQPRDQTWVSHMAGRLFTQTDSRVWTWKKMPFNKVKKKKKTLYKLYTNHFIFLSLGKKKIYSIIIYAYFCTEKCQEQTKSFTIVITSREWN